MKVKEIRRKNRNNINSTNPTIEAKCKDVLEFTEKKQSLSAYEHHVPPISSRVMFWRPRYLANSEWLQHIPFYFWLTEVLKPNIVVEPNLNSAAGYFAICQAVDKLNLDTFTHAAFGPGCNTARVEKYNHEHYREFSFLASMDESEFLNQFEDDSIDLLLLKNNSELLSTKAGRSMMQQRLSDSAIVLIHGSKSGNIRELCRELRKTYPYFELTQGHGLLLLCMGQHTPSRLEALIAQSKDASAQRLIQEIYSRLGIANEDAWQRIVYEKQVHSLTASLNDQTETIQQIQDAKQGLAEQLQQANSDFQTAKAQQEELNAQLLNLGAERNQDRQQKIALEKEKAHLDKEVIQLKQVRQDAADQVNKLQNDIDSRFAELATLAKLLADADSELEKIQKDNERLRDKEQKAELAFTDANKEKNQSTAKAIELEAQLKGLINENARLEKTVEQIQNNQQLMLDNSSKIQQKNQLETKQYCEENEQLKAALDDLRGQLQSQQQLNTMLERDQQVASEKISKLKQSELALQDSLSERFEELAVLTKILTEKEAEAIENSAVSKAGIEKASLADKLKKKLGSTKSKIIKPDPFAKEVKVIQQSSLFDEEWYKAQNSKAVTHKYGAAGHYLEFGVELGVSPSKAFDANWYLQTHQDVKNAGMNPLFHYIKFGREESRMIMGLNE